MTTETESHVYKYINGIDEVIRLYRNGNRALETPNLIDKVCELAGKTSPEVWNYVFPIIKERTFIHNDSEMRVTFVTEASRKYIHLIYMESADTTRKSSKFFVV